LGVTQADVGAALANLKIPGVGSLSQSTICRFESLTLSHNNMIALKPVLQAWLEEAEAAHREKNAKPELFSCAERKRKRTSIAAPEKRSLEAYFAIQPRPSSEKIAAIAEKLDLKKNVVRAPARPAGHPVGQRDLYLAHNYTCTHTSSAGISRPSNRAPEMKYLSLSFGWPFRRWIKFCPAFRYASLRNQLTQMREREENVYSLSFPFSTHLFFWVDILLTVFLCTRVS
ncbi:POU domain, class 4, transcription factor 3, partial [Ophiophagus hannah]